MESEGEPDQRHDQRDQRHGPGERAQVRHAQQIERDVKRARHDPQSRAIAAGTVEDDEAEIERDEEDEVFNVIGERAGGAPVVDIVGLRPGSRAVAR